MQKKLRTEGWKKGIAQKTDETPMEQDEVLAIYQGDIAPTDPEENVLADPGENVAPDPLPPAYQAAPADQTTPANQFVSSDQDTSFDQDEIAHSEHDKIVQVFDQNVLKNNYWSSNLFTIL